MDEERGHRGAARDRGAELMLRYQAGDESAFDALVEEFSPRVYSLLVRFAGPPRSGRRAGHEDLVQEVFLRVIRARAGYAPTARFTTWLYRIVFNLCVNEGQRSGPRRLVSLDTGAGEEGESLELVDPSAPDPSAQSSSGDVTRAVRGAIAQLPENQRMALVLAKFEDLPYRDIAEVLDSSEKAIKSLIHRARETLRERLAPFLQEELL